MAGLGFLFTINDHVAEESQFGCFVNGDAFDYWDPAAKEFKSAKDAFVWENVVAFRF